MSKQYLTIHTLDAAHLTDIFSLAPTPTSLLSASGTSSILVHSTQSPDFPLTQTLSGAHKLGCHHVSTSASGHLAASAGFGGEVKLWKSEDNGTQYSALGKLDVGTKAGEVWAVSLDAEGRYLAASSYDGRIGVWDLQAGAEGWEKVREYETKGSFGLCVAMSPDQKFTASGHENGSVYVFSNEAGKLMHSLPGLIKPIRAVAFSPLSTMLAAAGDALLISVYQVQSGECIANLPGHSAWITSVSFNYSGEYLLSGDFSGKAKVWNWEQKNCVATHGESEKGLWSVRWLPKSTTQREGAFGKSEMFAVAGAGRSIAFYREASGG